MSGPNPGVYEVRFEQDTVRLLYRVTGSYPADVILVAGLVVLEKDDIGLYIQKLQPVLVSLNQSWPGLMFIIIEKRAEEDPPTQNLAIFVLPSWKISESKESFIPSETTRSSGLSDYNASCRERLERKP